MKVLLRLTMCLPLASLRAAQDLNLRETAESRVVDGDHDAKAPWLWQFIDSTEESLAEDSNEEIFRESEEGKWKMQEAILNGSNELYRLLDEAGSQGEAEGEGESEYEDKGESTLEQKKIVVDQASAVPLTSEVPTREPPTQEPSTPAPPTLEPSTPTPPTLEPSTLASSAPAPPTLEPSTPTPPTLEPSTLASSAPAPPTLEPSTPTPPTLEPSTLASPTSSLGEAKYATNADVAPYNQCTDPVNYEPITTENECKHVANSYIPQGVFHHSGNDAHWPPGCFRYYGVGGSRVYLGTNSAGTGHVNHVMVCKWRVTSASPSPTPSNSDAESALIEKEAGDHGDSSISPVFEARPGEGEGEGDATDEHPTPAADASAPAVKLAFSIQNVDFGAMTDTHKAEMISSIKTTVAFYAGVPANNIVVALRRGSVVVDVTIKVLDDMDMAMVRNTVDANQAAITAAVVSDACAIAGLPTTGAISVTALTVRLSTAALALPTPTPEIPTHEASTELPVFEPPSLAKPTFAPPTLATPTLEPSTLAPSEAQERTPSNGEEAGLPVFPTPTPEISTHEPSTELPASEPPTRAKPTPSPTTFVAPTLEPSTLVPSQAQALAPAKTEETDFPWFLHDSRTQIIICSAAIIVVCVCGCGWGCGVDRLVGFCCLWGKGALTSSVSQPSGSPSRAKPYAFLSLHVTDNAAGYMLRRFAEWVKDELESAHNHEVFLCAIGDNDGSGAQITAALMNMTYLIPFITLEPPYARNSGGAYTTYHELKRAHESKSQIYPILMYRESEFPPKRLIQKLIDVDDTMAAGLINLTLFPSRVYHVADADWTHDCAKLIAAQIAQKLAEHLSQTLAGPWEIAPELTIAPIQVTKPLRPSLRPHPLERRHIDVDFHPLLIQADRSVVCCESYMFSCSPLVNTINRVTRPWARSYHPN